MLSVLAFLVFVLSSRHSHDPHVLSPFPQQPLSQPFCVLMVSTPDAAEQSQAEVQEQSEMGDTYYQKDKNWRRGSADVNGDSDSSGDWYNSGDVGYTGALYNAGDSEA